MEKQRAKAGTDRNGRLRRPGHLLERRGPVPALRLFHGSYKIIMAALGVTSVAGLQKIEANSKFASLAGPHFFLISMPPFILMTNTPCFCCLLYGNRSDFSLSKSIIISVLIR